MLGASIPPAFSSSFISLFRTVLCSCTPTSLHYTSSLPNMSSHTYLHLLRVFSSNAVSV